MPLIFSKSLLHICWRFLRNFLNTILHRYYRLLDLRDYFNNILFSLKKKSKPKCHSWSFKYRAYAFTLRLYQDFQKMPKYWKELPCLLCWPEHHYLIKVEQWKYDLCQKPTLKELDNTGREHWHLRVFLWAAWPCWRDLCNRPIKVKSIQPG